MILLPAVLMFVWVMTTQRRVLARAADVLAGIRDPEEKVEYLPFKSAWPSAKKRVMDSRINEVEQEGWTFLKATSAPFKETIRSWGGGLELHSDPYVRKGRLMEYSTAQPSDAADIEQLFIKTFADSEGQAEGEMIGCLARDFMSSTPEGDLYCFVAREDKQIVGCIFFSRITFESEIGAFILGPVAVHTNHQGKSIGQRLITFGIHTLSTDGVELVITYGDPDFYSKVGFHVVTERVIPAPLTLQHPEGWLAQSLKSEEIQPITGKSSCVEALNKPEYW